MSALRIIVRMTETDWRRVDHFSPKENWGDPNEMDQRIVFELDALRGFVGRPIVIHCGYEERTTGGYHPMGLAVDCHIVGLNLLDQFLVASRFGFKGIGAYPWWNNPGLHLDMRINAKHRATWGSVGPKQYVQLDADFIKKITRV